jgi:leucyl/phenylalanyl-tRNA--protein transferase
VTSRARNQAPFWIDPNDASSPFPDPELALREPDGLLAIGGNLSAERLLRAYAAGIFPWYTEGQPVLWWSPDPRFVLFPQKLKVSRSLHKTLRGHTFRITLDQAFDAVIRGCAAPRPGTDGTWITTAMTTAYQRLHELGFAHSAEAWQGDTLVGGLYGVAIGRVFFGESMFTRVNNASKVAFVALVRQLHAWDFPLVDCQVYTPHLASLGAEFMDRRDFLAQLRHLCGRPAVPSPWRRDDGSRGHAL